MARQSVEEFIAAASDPANRLVVSELPREGGGTMHVKFVRGRGTERLLAFFAAAAPLGRYQYPFLPVLHYPESQVTVCDPFYEEALAATEGAPGRGEMSVTGFCSGLGESYAGLLLRMREALGVKRLVAAGSSAGGTAAMFTAARVPGSVCVAANPVLDGPERCRGRYRGEYLHLLDAALDRVAATINADPLPLYEAGAQCTLALLVNNMSPADVRQAARFVDRASSGPGGGRNIVLKSDFWGIHGHRGSVPIPELHRWVSAAFSAPGWDAASVAAQCLRDSGGRPGETAQVREMNDRIARCEG